jgi:hypothetical protein
MLFLQEGEDFSDKTKQKIQANIASDTKSEKSLLEKINKLNGLLGDKPMTSEYPFQTAMVY